MKKINSSDIQSSFDELDTKVCNNDYLDDDD